jgi:hypothetical protein
MAPIINVLWEEYEYNPNEWVSRAAWNAWRATAVGIDNAYENLGNWCYEYGHNRSATWSNTVPVAVTVPGVRAPQIEYYCLESSQAYYSAGIQSAWVGARNHSSRH